MIQMNRCETCQTKIVTDGTGARMVTKRIHPCGRTDIEIRRCHFALGCKALKAFHGTAIRTIENARNDCERLQQDCPLKYLAK